MVVQRRPGSALDVVQTIEIPRRQVERTPLCPDHRVTGALDHPGAWSSPRYSDDLTQAEDVAMRGAGL